MSRYALITGASSGIGLSMSSELAARNYNLLLVSNEKEGLEIAKNEIEKNHEVVILTLNIDLSSSDAPIKVFEYCITK